MTGYNELKAWMERKYGPTTTEDTITCDGETYTGYMYGNDECFDTDEFYQYFLTPDALIKMYYAIPEGCEDYGNIDYYKPYDLRDADAQYWVDYLI